MSVDVVHMYGGIWGKRVAHVRASHRQMAPAWYCVLISIPHSSSATVFAEGLFAEGLFAEGLFAEGTTSFATPSLCAGLRPQAGLEHQDQLHMFSSAITVHGQCQCLRLVTRGTLNKFWSCARVEHNKHRS